MCTPVFVEFRRMCVTVTSDSSQLCRLLRNPLNARPRWTRSSFLYHQPPPPPPRITRFLHIVASSVYETFLNSCTFILTMWLHVCLKHLRLFASLTELFFMQFTLKVISKLNKEVFFFTKCLFSLSFHCFKSKSCAICISFNLYCEILCIVRFECYKLNHHWLPFWVMMMVLMRYQRWRWGADEVLNLDFKCFF